MRLWVEFAYQTGCAPGLGTQGNVLRTLTSEERFGAVLVSGAVDREQPAAEVADEVLRMMQQGASHPRKTTALLDLLPDAYMPVAVLEAWQPASGDALEAALLEIDAPPLFMIRRGRLVLPPVIEEEFGSRLVRRADLKLQDADHLAMVSESYIRVCGGVRPWSWQQIAVSIRRLTETRCDARQLAAALVRLAGRSGPAASGDGEPASGFQLPIAVLALFVRRMRTATVWSGPPADRSREQWMLEALLAEGDTRIICGDTTAEIAARLLGARLRLEPPPAEGWWEVPPVSRLVAADGSEPVALVTEGLVTLGVARERLAGAGRTDDLAGRRDGASRLARLLLAADKVRFVVGLAVNPMQAAQDGTPLRKAAIEELALDLRRRGKIVVVEYV